MESMWPFFTCGPISSVGMRLPGPQRSLQPGPVVAILEVLRAVCGTGGVSYLRKMLDVVLFSEIWKLRTDL